MLLRCNLRVLHPPVHSPVSVFCAGNLVPVLVVQ